MKNKELKDYNNDYTYVNPILTNRYIDKMEKPSSPSLVGKNWCTGCNKTIPIGVMCLTIETPNKGKIDKSYYCMSCLKKMLDVSIPTLQDLRRRVKTYTKMKEYKTKMFVQLMSGDDGRDPYYTNPGNPYFDRAIDIEKKNHSL